MRKRSPKQGISTEYRGIKYRSRWEVYVAKLLLYSDITFHYEPRRFFITPSLSYLPDFYLPRQNIYIEVKGVLSYKDDFLLKAFSEVERVVYLGKKELAYIHGKNASNLSKLDVSRYHPEKQEVYRFMKFIEGRNYYVEHRFR